MGDRAEEIPPRAEGPLAPGTTLSAAVPLALFSMTTGVFAVAAGALAALLVPGSMARALVWAVVTIVAAAGAGLWWGITPVTERLRVLDRAAAAVRPRGSQTR
ncbi:hypothetical protein [Streptomyces sp. NPDC047009]|uniref:hypothetical protein n=1 Tax=Streptomyces sp. NPDC047009 TaxID=3154496 RepID=UPI0033C77667